MGLGLDGGVEHRGRGGLDDLIHLHHRLNGGLEHLGGWACDHFNQRRGLWAVWALVSLLASLGHRNDQAQGI